MEKDQLIDGIARAVKAAEPAPEFCLKLVEQGWWSCMTKAEWSGWMQAVFSVLAIAAAIAIAWWQRREERMHGHAVHLAQAQVVAGRATIAVLNLYAVVDGLLARWNKHYESQGIEPTVVDIHHYSQELIYPEPADLLVMAHAWPVPIATISKAIGHVELAIDTLRRLSDQIKWGGTVEQADALQPIVLLTGARNSLLAAVAKLPGGEQPQSNPVPPKNSDGAHSSGAGYRAGG